MTASNMNAPRYLLYGEGADGVQIDRKAQIVALSNSPDADKRKALLRLILEDPRIEDGLRRLQEDDDRNRALRSLEGKILDGPLARSPLDLSRIAAGDSFSGWAYKTFKLMAADARRKGAARRGREISLEDCLGGEGRIGEISLGVAVRDSHNPYKTIAMRRPMGRTYNRAEKAVKATGGNPSDSLDAGLAVLDSEHWVLSDETDAVDERLILSLLLPRLNKDERARLDAMYEGMGEQIAYSDRGNGLGKLWKLLDSASSRSGIPSMTLWEHVTHSLFDMRWTYGER